MDKSGDIEPDDLLDMDTWVEVTAQSLGFMSTGHSLDNTGLQAMFGDGTLEKMLIEAQEQDPLPVLGPASTCDTPPSPPPSRDDYEMSSASSPHPMVKGSGSIVSEFCPLDKMKDKSANICPGEPSAGSNLAITPSYSLRHSTFMKNRLVKWFIDNMTTVLTHSAAFVVGFCSALYAIKRSKCNIQKSNVHSSLLMNQMTL